MGLTSEQVSGTPQGGTKAGLRCPRCESTNTKFCYYNNYSMSQPRHFCRACRRYWTDGGALRDVPVGGTRKSKRRKVSETHSTAAAASAAPTTTFSVWDGIFPDHGFAPATCFPPVFPGAGGELDHAASPNWDGVAGWDGMGMMMSAWPVPAALPANYWDEIADVVGAEINCQAPGK